MIQIRTAKLLHLAMGEEVHTFYNVLNPLILLTIFI